MADAPDRDEKTEEATPRRRDEARDKGQVEFAKRFLSSAKGLVKPILVGGEPLKLMREWKREIFYDQGGALTRRFSITQSPAVVSQEGKRLRVDEIRL